MPRRPVLALLALLAAAGPAAAQPAPPGTEAFRREAVAVNALEAETSRLALSRSSNPRVRSFARRIIREQAAAQRALGARAEADPRRAARLAELSSLRGRAFDMEYARQQVAALGEAVELYRAYAAGGTDPSLRAHARATLPRLESQLAFATRLAGSADR